MTNRFSFTILKNNNRKFFFSFVSHRSFESRIEIIPMNWSMSSWNLRPSIVSQFNRKRIKPSLLPPTMDTFISTIYERRAPLPNTINPRSLWRNPSMARIIRVHFILNRRASWPRPMLGKASSCTIFAWRKGKQGESSGERGRDERLL